MEKRFFNKLIKEQMLSRGFEKAGGFDYSKQAKDGITKIIVRTPDQTFGFGVGVKFKDFGGDYSGKSSGMCMAYPKFSQALTAAVRNDYTEEQVISATQDLLDDIEQYLQGGRDAIRQNIDQWVFGLDSEKKKNEIYAYLDLPLIDPYSEAYILQKIESFFKQGGKSMLPLAEYTMHKEHYDKYALHGCTLAIGDEFVTISYSL